MSVAAADSGATTPGDSAGPAEEYLCGLRMASCAVCVAAFESTSGTSDASAHCTLAWTALAHLPVV